MIPRQALQIHPLRHDGHFQSEVSITLNKGVSELNSNIEHNFLTSIELLKSNKLLFNFSSISAKKRSRVGVALTIILGLP